MTSATLTNHSSGAQAKPDYILAVDHHATTRLALQHYIWRDALGFNIHPSIPKLPDHAKIADVATGTSLWSIDVLRELKATTQLTAFDINLNQAPHPKMLPPNMELQHWNIFETPPDKYWGLFDLVHVRFVTLLLKELENFEQAISNIVKLLKPGGWLQWDECKTHACFLVKADDSLPTPSMDYLRDWLARQRHGSKTDLAKIWNNGFPDLLKQAGLDMVVEHDHSDRASARLDLMRFNSAQLLTGFEQVAELAYRPGEEDYERLTRSIKGATLETSQGCVLVVPPFMWTAQKPL